MLSNGLTENEVKYSCPEWRDYTQTNKYTYGELVLLRYTNTFNFTKSNYIDNIHRYHLLFRYKRIMRTITMVKFD